MRSLSRALAVGAAAIVLGGGTASLARAQSLLDRPDNISADWVGNTGTLYFNFVHRFSQSPAPERKVTNFPTFLIATGIASKALVGASYATNSALAARYPNEWEFFARYAPLQQEAGAPLDLGGQLDYNMSVKGVDGELSIARREGPVRLVAVGRVIADTLGGSKMRFAFGGGGTLRFGRFIALAADAAALTRRASGEAIAWSAGLHIALPNTPHTLSLHVSNATTSTVQGLTRGGDTRRYGFEFTIPVHVGRFFNNPEPVTPAVDGARGGDVPRAAGAAKPEAPGGAAAGQGGVPSPAPAGPTPAPSPSAEPVQAPEPAPAQSRAVGPEQHAPADSATPKPQPERTAPTAAPRPAAAAGPAGANAAGAPARTAPARAAAPAAPKVVTARMKGQAYLPTRLEIGAGTTVRWMNLDALIHTVTAVDKSFDSGIIGADGSYSHTFTKPGTYPVYCLAHPFMKATVVVR